MNRNRILGIGVAAITAAAAIGTVSAAETAADTTEIVFSDTGAVINGSGAKADGSKVKITSEGSYAISGTSDDAEIVISADKDDDVVIILDGANLSNEDDYVIYEKKAGSVTITTAEGSDNILNSGTEDMYGTSADAESENDADADAGSDGKGSAVPDADAASDVPADIATGTDIIPAGNVPTEYVTESEAVSAAESADTADSDIKTDENTADDADADTGENEDNDDNSDSDDSQKSDDKIKAVIYAKDDLILNGSGSLTVNGYLNNGIQSKGDITIAGGTYNVTSSNDAIKGKDSVTVENGSITITSASDGIVSDGDITIEDGTFDITTGDGANAGSAEFDFAGNKGNGFEISDDYEMPEGFSDWLESAADMPEAVKTWLTSVSEIYDSLSSSDMGRNSGQMPGGNAPQMPGSGDVQTADGETPEADAGTASNQQAADSASADSSNAGTDQAAANGSAGTDRAADGNVPQMPGSGDNADTHGMGGKFSMGDIDYSAVTSIPEELNSYLETSGASEVIRTWIQKIEELLTTNTFDFDSNWDMDNMFGDSSDESGESRKGIKCEDTLTINAGIFTMNTDDDAFHSSDIITVNGGDFNINASDDGMHADNELIINSGTLNIEQSYEGLEATYITLNDGDVSIVSSDDGLNAYGGGNAFGMMGGGMDFGKDHNQGGGFSMMPGGNTSDAAGNTSEDNMNGKPSGVSQGAAATQTETAAPQATSSSDQSAAAQTEMAAPQATSSSDQSAATAADTSSATAVNTPDGTPDSGSDPSEARSNETAESADDAEDNEIPTIYINGGTLYINAGGDGIDSNGSLYVTAGDVYVDGPANGGNSAIDLGSENQGVGVITGGTITAIGYASMAESFDDSSTQYSFIYTFDSSLSSGTDITITDEDGNILSTASTIKSCDCIQYSSPLLKEGMTLTITAGEQTGTITLDSVYSSNGSSGFGNFGNFDMKSQPENMSPDNAGNSFPGQSSSEAAGDDATAADSEKPAADTDNNSPVSNTSDNSAPASNLS